MIESDILVLLQKKKEKYFNHQIFDKKQIDLKVSVINIIIFRLLSHIFCFYIQCF